MPSRSALQQRLKPAGALLVGLAMLGLNLFMLTSSGRYFPKMLFIACGLTLAALCAVILGEPTDPYGNRPKWYTVAIIASGIVGLLVAVALNIELQSSE